MVIDSHAFFVKYFDTLRKKKLNAQNSCATILYSSSNEINIIWMKLLERSEMIEKTGRGFYTYNTL
uniref:Uncharacterized protein n=1 Tax=Rhizophagus irregularis (strain DAOM 181602 / DAOM 197198 / MUCL 43194) TaxID=747089 RepID=U9TYA9_RHIID